MPSYSTLIARAARAAATGNLNHMDAASLCHSALDNGGLTVRERQAIAKIADTYGPTATPAARIVLAAALDWAVKVPRMEKMETLLVEDIFLDSGEDPVVGVTATLPSSAHRIAYQKSLSGRELTITLGAIRLSATGAGSVPHHDAIIPLHELEPGETYAVRVLDRSGKLLGEGNLTKLAR